MTIQGDEEIADFLNSTAGRHAWEQWWRQLDERLARDPTPPTKAEIEAAIRTLAKTLHIDFALANGLVMRKLLPDKYAEFTKRGRH